MPFVSVAVVPFRRFSQCRYGNARARLGDAGEDERFEDLYGVLQPKSGAWRLSGHKPWPEQGTSLRKCTETGGVVEPKLDAWWLSKWFFSVVYSAGCICTMQDQPGPVPKRSTSNGWILGACSVVGAQRPQKIPRCPSLTKNRLPRS